METEKQNTVADTIEKFTHDNLKSFVIKTFQTLNPNIKFEDNWHLDLIIQYLNAICEGRVKRLIINIPPRSLKSTIVSIAWPAWLLAMDPSKRIIVASYSQALSLKHSEECRLIMNSDWYKNQFPHTRIRRGSNSKGKFITTKNGFRFATSIDGTLTGEGADVLIVDDPHTPLQAESTAERNHALTWFDQTFSSRLNDKKRGSIVVVMQRLHTNDLSGHLLKKKHWTHLKLPAIAQDDTTYEFETLKYKRQAGELLNAKRENLSEIEMAKVELGSYAFNAQYLQEPVRLTGGLIKYSWLQKSDTIPKSFDFIYQSWDCAVKIKAMNDFTVCTTWGIKDNKYYLLDVLREKLEFPELKIALFKAADNYNPNAVLIEDKASGQALIQELKKASHLQIIPILPTKDKFTRLLSVSSFFESGNILLPRHASWLHEYESELTNFPNAEHDDMVDSTSQFLEWYISKSIKNRALRAF
jgi:predicted phage terminase large subunit-like protein